MIANVILFPQKSNNDIEEPIVNADYFGNEKFDFYQIFKALDQLKTEDK